MAEKLTITVTPGPLKVSGAETIHYRGAPVSVDGDAYLCRCGGTNNPPFCDGAHTKNGFDGNKKTSAKKPLKVWEGRKIRTVFNPNTCMHVFYCKPLGELRKREEEGDEAAAEEIARTVLSCPSGALTYEFKSSAVAPSVGEGVPDLDIQEGGEIRVQCEFELSEDLNESQPNDRATLCRCGLSNNKPFCDGRHVAKKDFY